jgi:hypothetical protein
MTSRPPATYVCATVRSHPFIRSKRLPPDECAYCTVGPDEPEHEGQGVLDEEEE